MGPSKPGCLFHCLVHFHAFPICAKKPLVQMSTRTYLCQRDGLASAKERPGVLQEGLYLLLHGLDDLGAQFLLLLPLRLENRIHVPIHLANKCIGEEGNAGPRQRARRTLPAGGPEAGAGEEVGDEGADDGGLGDDFVVEDAVGDFQAGDEAARVDFEVPGLAGAVERDDDFFVGDVEGAEGDLGTVGPGTKVVGVEGY